MVIEFRLYKRFDADLISLYNADYPVSAMIRDAVIGYANGVPVHYYIDEPTYFDAQENKTVRSRFIVPNSDVKTCYMLKHIKGRYRNSFVKMVLRNALVQQNLICYFTDGSLYQLQSENAKGMNIYGFSNLIPCSSLKNSKPKQINFAGQTITRQKKPAKKKQPQVFTSITGVVNTGAAEEVNPFINTAPAPAMRFTQPVSLMPNTVPQMQPVIYPVAPSPAPAMSYAQGQMTPLPQAQYMPPVQQPAQQPAQPEPQPGQYETPVRQTPEPQTQQIQEAASVTGNPVNMTDAGHSPAPVVQLASNDALMNIFDSI